MQLFHGRAAVEFHTLKQGEGRPLLLLHALGSSSAAWPDRILDGFAGPVFAIDFAGHGMSSRLRGGAYYPEHFLADADLALEQIAEPCALLGAGIGAYVALMLAGSRPDSVLGGLLVDRAGFDGVGSLPDDELVFEDIEGFERFIAEASTGFAVGTDPLVAQCAGDMRPTHYAKSYAQAARPMLFSRGVGKDRPQPGWWASAREANRGIEAPEEIIAGLADLGALVSQA